MHLCIRCNMHRQVGLHKQWLRFVFQQSGTTQPENDQTGMLFIPLSFSGLGNHWNKSVIVIKKICGKVERHLFIHCNCYEGKGHLWASHCSFSFNSVYCRGQCCCLQLLWVSRSHLGHCSPCRRYSPFSMPSLCVCACVIAYVCRCTLWKPVPAGCRCFMSVRHGCATVCVCMLRRGACDLVHGDICVVQLAPVTAGSVYSGYSS